MRITVEIPVETYEDGDMWVSANCKYTKGRSPRYLTSLGQWYPGEFDSMEIENIQWNDSGKTVSLTKLMEIDPLTEMRIEHAVRNKVLSDLNS